MTPTPNKRNRSAACGAWSHGKDENGIEQHAHEYCHGIVNLPAPRDVCSCWCHGHDDADEFDGTADEFERMVECHREWQAERAMGNDETFAEWLKS